MPAGPCKLCSKIAELQLSHVIPAFVFRWKRDTSGGGYLRFGTAPNKRVQDGIQKYWLCAECEGRIGRWESTFAARIFYPYSEGRGTKFRYGSWLLNFGISVAWRVLQEYKEEGHLKDDPADRIAKLEEASQVWRNVLLAQRPNPGKFELHMFPLDAIESADAPALPSNINRYLMRAVDTDVVHGENTVFVYAKLARFMFLGFARLDHRRDWVGSKVLATEGYIEPRKFVVPKAFWAYVTDRARRMEAVNAAISPRQRTKIDQSLRANIDKFTGSDLHRAMEEDVRMFGSSAFSQTKEPSSE